MYCLKVRTCVSAATSVANEVQVKVEAQSATRPGASWAQAKDRVLLQRHMHTHMRRHRHRHACALIATPTYLGFSESI